MCVCVCTRKAALSLLLPTALTAGFMASLPKALRKLPVAARKEANGTDIPTLFTPYLWYFKDSLVDSPRAVSDLCFSFPGQKW